MTAAVAYLGVIGRWIAFGVSLLFLVAAAGFTLDRASLGSAPTGF